MSAEIVSRLKALKLHGMAANWPELVARCRHAALEPEQLVEQLLDAEGAERTVRSIAYQMTAARFPAHRDLAGFDFTASAVDEALVRKLHTTQFTEAAHNPMLGEMLERLSNTVYWLQFRVYVSQREVATSNREHRKRVDAVLAGDANAAEAAILEHVETARELIQTLSDEHFARRREL